VIITNIDVRQEPVEVTSINSALREYTAGTPTATLTVNLLSSEDYRNLQSMLGRNVTLVESSSANNMPTYASNVIGDREGIKNTGQIKERMLEFSKPQPIKTRQITSAIKELDLNE
jgi:hypothetical protein